MKILAAMAGILFALWYTSFVAKAEDVHYMDMLKLQGQHTYCAWWTDNAMFGARNVLWESTRVIEPIPPTANAKEFRGITVNQEIWASWDERSRNDYTEAVFFGYDQLAELKKRGQTVFNGAELQTRFYEHCMLRRSV